MKRSWLLIEFEVYDVELFSTKCSIKTLFDFGANIILIKEFSSYREIDIKGRTKADFPPTNWPEKWSQFAKRKSSG